MDARRGFAGARLVAKYDATMARRHPNRAAMADAVVALLRAGARPPRRIVDLGTGTGFLLDRLLSAFPAAHGAGLDASPEMLAVARARLARFGRRALCVDADVTSADFNLARLRPADAVVALFALHHLRPAEKLACYRIARRALRPGRWLVNADIHVSSDPFVERLWQAGHLPSSHAAMDRPIPLQTDLGLLRRAGLRHVAVHWQSTREAVIAGVS